MRTRRGGLQAGAFSRFAQSDTNFGLSASLLREMTERAASASRAATACMEKYIHESCNTDSCPLETDLSPVKRAAWDPCSLDLNYGQKGEGPRLHPLRHLPFSFVRKIDFKKAINLQQFISSDHLHFVLPVIRLYYIV